jgi:hypothetical protein
MRTQPAAALPIACSLDAGRLQGRVAEIAAAGQALRDIQAGLHVAVLRFVADERSRERLTAIVAAESQCCAFMGFDLRDEIDEVVLTITAPEGAEPVLDDFVAAFSSGMRA